ncbi:asparagine synthase-related protein [Jeotgalibacillus malaysiensis]|uniref:asparagine synthase-related protein n=1 Tax=Jeotgalibacillus malaysiensis TaxID=1508404 RepID=UPI00384CC18B
MSALAAIISPEGHQVLVESCERMMEAYEEFPSDDRQTYFNRNVFLGNHAQWMTPESVGEMQPYHCKESGCVITADAIIDNRKELFDLLDIEGIKLSDAQLILKTYLKYGEKSPAKLIGDFSFIIWDPKNQSIFGARDFSGLRTLYYAKHENSYYLASTIRAIQYATGINNESNEEWLAEFLGVPGYVPGVGVEMTPIEGIKQVPPAHYFTIKNGAYRQHRYITLPENEKIRFKTDEEYAAAFKEIFERAVKDRLRTVGKVGSFLSGGLDSGSVTSVAAQELKKQKKSIHSFSVIPVAGFSDWTSRKRVANEEEYIEEILKLNDNIIHHYESFPERNSYRDIDQWIDIMETPYKFFENSYWIRGVNERAAQEGVSVLLNGSRGNFTVSWGNPFDHFSHLLKSMKLTRLLREIQEFHIESGQGRKSIVEKTLTRLQGNRTKGEKIETLLNEKYFAKHHLAEKLQNSSLITHTEQTFNAYDWRKKYFNQLFYLSNYTAAAKLSLRYKVWTRDPTNDLRVVRFCLSIPEDQFVKHGMDRALIRRSMDGVLPEKIRLNYQVRGLQSADLGFRVKKDWHSLREEIFTLLQQDKLSPLVNREKVKQLLEQAGETPSKALTLDYDFKLLMGFIILNRYMNNLKGGETYEERMERAIARKA